MHYHSARTAPARGGQLLTSRWRGRRGCVDGVSSGFYRRGDSGFGDGDRCVATPPETSISAMGRGSAQVVDESDR
jgi:hypothetical protein